MVSFKFCEEGNQQVKSFYSVILLHDKLSPLSKLLQYDHL